MRARAGLLSEPRNPTQIAIDAPRSGDYALSIPTGLRCGAIPRDHQPGHTGNPEGSPIPCPNLVPTSGHATVGHVAEPR